MARCGMWRRLKAAKAQGFRSLPLHMDLRRRGRAEPRTLARLATSTSTASRVQAAQLVNCGCDADGLEDLRWQQPSH